VVVGAVEATVETPVALVESAGVPEPTRAAAATPLSAQLDWYHEAILATSLASHTSEQMVEPAALSVVRYPDWQKHDS
jgi:hypothetical protein